MSASSISGVGQGSAMKLGTKGSESQFLAVEKLIGPRVVFASTFTLSGSTGAVSFPTTLSGVSADYIVLANGAHNSYATNLSTSGFTMNGTSADVVSFAVLRLTNATVQVN